MRYTVKCALDAQRLTRMSRLGLGPQMRAAPSYWLAVKDTNGR